MAVLALNEQIRKLLYQREWMAEGAQQAILPEVGRGRRWLRAVCARIDLFPSLTGTVVLRAD